MIPSFISQLVRTIIVVSLSGGILATLLLLIKPVVRHRLPKSSQYLFWLIVLATFLVPVSRITAIPSVAGDIAPIHNVVERTVISTAEARARLPVADIPLPAPAPGVTTNIPAPPPIQASPTEAPSLATIAVTAFMFAYPIMAALVLIYSLTGYALFLKKLRRGYMAPHPHELQALAQLTKGRRTPRLMISKHALTPMLIGVFRPIIVLPSQEYTPSQLNGILLHELTHMRRQDVAVKWLSLLACAAHWFNPLIWITRREIDRICELSCDEAVIRNMDTGSRQHYGETLITVASTKKMPLPVLSTTMSVEMRAMKERLISIMRNRQQHTKLAVFISSLIVLTAILVACTSGAATGQNDGATPEYTHEYYEEDTTPTPPLTIEDHAHAYIQSLLPGLNVFREDTGEIAPATIVATQINTLERVAEFTHILPQTIELWRLDFMLQTECIEDGNIRWGTFAPDQDGWLGQHTGWNDANILLAFIPHEDGPEILWNLPWSVELHTNTQTIWGLETALRMTLEARNYVPAMAFPGNHYVVYFHMGYEYGRVFMSQPVEQGPGGIWVAERWQQIGNNQDFIRETGDFQNHIATPYNMNLNQNFQEQAQYLQNQFTGGQAPWLASPYESALEFLHSQWLSDAIVAMYPIGPDITIPTSLPPHIFQNNPSGETLGASGIPNSAGEWPPALPYPLPSDIERYIWTALMTLQPGTARTQVERDLGTPHRVGHAYGDSYSFRHNILANQNFLDNLTFEWDEVELEALQDGRMRLLAFARYSIPDVLTSFTIYYSTPEGVIYEIRYMGDAFLPPGFDSNLFSQVRIGGPPATHNHHASE